MIVLRPIVERLRASLIATEREDTQASLQFPPDSRRDENAVIWYPRDRSVFRSARFERGRITPGPQL